MTVSKEALKTIIKEKFGSAKRFCAVTNIPDEYQLLRRLIAPNIKNTETEKKKRIELYNLAAKTSNKVLDNEITKDERLWLRKVIKTIFSGVDGFSRKYPQLPKTTVKDIIDGRTKKKTQAYDVLVATLNEELNNYE